MRILGIDPGLNITGYGVIEGKGKSLQLVEAGVIRTKRSLDIGKRLDQIYRGLVEVINETRPGCLVLEKLYSHWRHPATSSLLGHARGIPCFISAQKKLPLINYPATRIKKAVVGRGNASKFQVQRVVAHVLNLDKNIKSPDAADALAVAIAHFYISNQLR